MQTMIERLARTMARKSCPPGGEAQFPYVSQAEWEESHWRDYADAARAILQELQNPTDAMAEAGAHAAWENVIDADAHSLRIIFAAMIDAALVGEA